MSYRGLLNHTVRVYREPSAEDSRDQFGSVALVPQPFGAAPSGYNARPAQNWRGTLINFGAGEEQGSANMWHLDRDMGARDRDVLHVIGARDTRSPNIGLKLRVMSVEPASDSNSVHHLEVNVEVWDGELGDA